MLRRSVVVCVVQLVLAVTVAVAQEAPVTQCDTYAGSRVAGDNLNFEFAIPACIAAVRRFPTSPRLKYQLGRAYLTAAKFTEAIHWFRQAAQYEYAPAQASLGYMSEYGEGTHKIIRTQLLGIPKLLSKASR